MSVPLNGKQGNCGHSCDFLRKYACWGQPQTRYHFGPIWPEVAGCSLSQIKAELDADGIPTAEGVKAWSHQVIQNILTNEKFAGDAVLQKTYVTDCISKRVKKNQGERPMYYVENHHPAIVTRQAFQRVKEEMARRASKRKVMQKSGKTEQGKYSAKYALSELLACGECGTPYKRVTWARNGQKRVVWRCISRLEYGTQYCHSSPTLDEERLHTAILAALNKYADLQEAGETAWELARLAQSGREGDGTSMLTLRERLAVLTHEQEQLLEKVLEDMDNPHLNAQLKALAEEKHGLLKQIEALRQREQQEASQQERLGEMRERLRVYNHGFTDYDDTVTRQMIEKITVLYAESVRVRFRDVDIELDEAL